MSLDRLEEAKRQAEEAAELWSLAFLQRKAPYIVADLLLSKPNPTILFDFSGKFAYVNPRFTEVTGYTNKQLEGKMLVDLIHPDDLEDTLSAMAYAAKGVAPRHFINRYVFADGQYHWVIWHPQKKAHDETIGVATFSLLDDIPTGYNAGFVDNEKVVKPPFSLMPLDWG